MADIAMEIASQADAFLSDMHIAPNTTANTAASTDNQQGAHQIPADNSEPDSLLDIAYLRKSLAKPHGAMWKNAFADPVPTELCSWEAILLYISWLGEHPLRAHLSDVMLVEWAAHTQGGGMIEWVEWGVRHWSTTGAFHNNPLLFLAHVMEAVRVAMEDKALVAFVVSKGWEERMGPVGDWVVEEDELCDKMVKKTLKKVWLNWAGAGDATMVDAESGTEVGW